MGRWDFRRTILAFVLLLIAEAGCSPLRADTDAAAGPPSASLTTERAEAATTWPFEPPPLATLREAPHKVFAHWHVWPISLDNQAAANDYWSRELMTAEGRKGQNATGGGFARERPLPRPPIAASDWQVVDMETEVRRAATIGLDGFIFNIVQPPPNKHYDRLPAMLEAAQRVDPSFRVVLMIDAVASKDRSPEEMATAITQVASHPSLLHTKDGRLVITAFTAERRPQQWWQQFFAKLDAAGIKTSFVPVFQGWQAGMKQFAAMSDGFSDWGRRTPSGVQQMVRPIEEAHKLGKIWMAPVSPQLFRPKNLFYKEAVGSTTFRDSWQVAIDNNADWVQIITWNDYGEGTEIAPSTGIQYAFYDLAAYYTTWFKTGVQPPITRDVLYYFHRIMPSSTPAEDDQQERAFEAREAQPPQDIIELLAFLTEPGKLVIEIGGKTYTQEAKAGITSFQAPLAPGRPRFKLVRDGTDVIDFASAFEIRTKADFQDLLYRAGSSSRPPVDMIANPAPRG